MTSPKRSGSYHLVSPASAPIICPLCSVAHTTVDSTLFSTYQYLYFTAGVYTSTSNRITLTGGNYIIGDGIGRTVINCSFKFPGNVHIGGGGNYGLTLGKGYHATTTGHAFQFTDGANACYFNSVRFRAHNPDSEAELFDMSDYASWPQSGPSTAAIVSPNRKCNVRNVYFNDCEFEWCGGPNWQFNMWWDVRAGGGNIDNIQWKRCVFGARNSQGLFPGYGGAVPVMGHILLQPAPSEHGYYGPRPYDTSAPGYPIDYGWNQWGDCTHGAGKSSEYVNPQGFYLEDCYFNGDDTTGQIDVCCNSRSYWFTSKPNGTGGYYYEDHPSSDPTEADLANTPSLYNGDAYDIGTNTGWELQNCWFGGGLRLEIGPFENPERDNVGARRDSATTNSVPDLVDAVWDDDDTPHRQEWIYWDHRGDGNDYYLTINGVYVPSDLTYNVPTRVASHENQLYNLGPFSALYHGPIGQIPT